MDGSFFRRLVAVIAVAAIAPGLIAQTSEGILAGVARDRTGAVVPHAKVTITNEATGEVRVGNTKNDGAYRIEAVPPGRYTVVIEDTGFDTQKEKGVVVNPSIVSSLDVVLSVGRVNDVVEVQAVANSINTENGQITGIIDQNEIAKLPIFSLNPIELATTLPGIQVITQPGSGAGAQGQIFSANGARPRANNFLLDSQEDNDVSIEGQAFQPDIPDMYESVAVLSNSASAEYGRAGGAVVNLITRRGTNSYHGSVYERYTGSGLNALSGTQRQSKSLGPVKKTRFDRHTFGFTGGGKLIKDKLFVFGGSEWQRFYGGTLEGRQELPDPTGIAALQSIQKQVGTIQAQQAALFANYLSNYSYVKTFQDTSLASASKPYYEQLAVIAPGCPTAGCNVETGLYQRPSVPEQNTDTQWTVRVDYTPSDKNSFYVRYIHDRSFLTPDFGNNASLPGFDSQQGGAAELSQVAWTHVLSPRVLNEARLSETRVNFAFVFTPQTLANPLNVTPTLSFGGNNVPNLGPNQNLPQGRAEDLYQLQDTVGLSFGRQAIRAGVDLGRQIEKEQISQNALGTLSYTASGSYGSSIGEFINNDLGSSGSATITFGPPRVDPRNWRETYFIQDDVKLSSELTVNVGARYDYLSDPENSVQYPAINPLTVLSVPLNTVYKVSNDYNNISPRLGFAYVPHFGFFADGKTVFHSGFGVYFDSDFSNILVNAAQSSPNAIAQTAQQTGGDGLANSNTLIGTLKPVFNPLTASATSVVNNLVNPYTYQFNFGMERELPLNLKLTTNYVGSRGVKLFANRQYNYFNPSDGTTATARLNPAMGPIVARGNFAASDYNSLQAELTRAFTHGITFRAAYTYSKDLDDASEIFTTFSSPTSYSADLSPTGLRRDWGNSAWDHRNYLVVSYVWAPKGFTASNAIENGALGALTRHWTVSGVERFQSGPYTTISVSGIDTNQDGSTANDRPILNNRNAPFNSVAIDASYLKGPQGVYYDLYAYNTIASKPKNIIDPNSAHWIVQRGQHYLQQEIGRNSFLQPGYQQHDIALEKGIGLSYLRFQQGVLTLRVEANNIGNHNNVNPLGSNIYQIGQSSQFNPVISRTGAGRSLVLWAKINF